MPETTTSVTITRAEYDRLMQESDMLACLEAAGVDEWDGYQEAQRMHNAPDDES